MARRRRKIDAEGFEEALAVSGDLAAILVEHDMPVGDKPIGPDPFEAGTSAPVVLAFDGAKDATLDGSVTFDLALGGQNSESIGFGLTPTS